MNEEHFKDKKFNQNTHFGFFFHIFAHGDVINIF